MSMSRRSAARRQPARSRALPRWVVPAAGVVLALAAAWWLLVRDAGATGGSRTIASYRPPDIHALAVQSDDLRHLIFGSHRGMLVSPDGGKTWDPLGPSGDAMGIASPPGSSTTYAAGHDVFFRSDDAGRTWSSARPALPGTDIHGIAGSAVRPGTFYAVVVGQGLFRSDDAGQTWQRAGTAPGSTMSLTAAAASGTDVLFASTMEGVQRSRDGGATWERVPELGGASVSAAGSQVYATAGTGVLVSGDGGTTWQQRPFPPGRAALAAPAPADASTVYVLTEELAVWRSSDGGRTWERMS